MAEPTPRLPVGPWVPLAIRPSPLHGLGVFAVDNIEHDATIEVCPTILVPDPEVPHLEQTVLREFYFPWDGGVAVVLGFGMVYNHSFDPNAAWLPMPVRGYGAGVVVMRAIRPIAAGEEITHNYTGTPRGKAELWFDPKPDRAEPA